MKKPKFNTKEVKSRAIIAIYEVESALYTLGTKKDKETKEAVREISKIMHEVCNNILHECYDNADNKFVEEIIAEFLKD